MNRTQKILLLVLAGILTVLLMVKIDLFTADLGRHIKNGEIILTGSAEARHAVLTTNYYSYTEGSAPFINHHWLSGVFFFLVFKIADFPGLSIFYIACVAGAFLLIVDLARKKVGPLALLSISLVALPIIASRAEVRPEAFTYLFVALFIWIVWRFSEGTLNRRWLWLLSLLQFLWVNLHIGFILGLFILGVFFITLLLQRDFLKAKYLGFAAGASGLATLLNPSFLSGALYPFRIFGFYSYRVFENQSISFLSTLGVGNPFTFSAYKILLALVLISYILAAFVHWRKIALPIFIVNVAFGVMGWIAIRDFPLFGLVGVMALVLNIPILRESGGSMDRLLRRDDFSVLVFIVLTLTGAVLSIGLIAGRSSNFGIGIPKETMNAAYFFKEHNLQGPIFNNYDIGGYLIYTLFPAEKVFFDNRPEAYTVQFVDEKYKAAMEDPKAFKALDEQYAFNVIFFYYRDYTPWGQAFITKKVFDPEWAPVYVDADALILLKRNKRNDAIIRAYEVPQEIFTISQ